MARAKNSRNAAGSGSIRQRSNGSWEARVTIGTDPGTGKPIRKSFYGKTQKEVREKMQRAAVDVTDGAYFEPSSLTLGAWLDIWITDYQGDKKYATTRTYRGNIDTHIKPALGAVKLAQLAPHQIQRFYNGLLNNGSRAPKRDRNGEIVKKDGHTVFEAVPMSPKTVRNIHGTLIKALNVAVDIGYLKDNPAERVTLPRVQKTEIKPLTDEQVTLFLKSVQADSFAAILQTIIFTGLRESEAIGLTWDCIDLKAGVIKVSKQLQKRPIKDGGTVFAPVKNGKPRTITVAPFVIQLLEQQRTAQIKQRLKAGEAWEGWQNEKDHKKALVFTNDVGKPLTPTTLRNHFKAVVTQIGAPECRVHDLRHTFAVLSLQNGDDIKTVQENLGHATAAFTLDVYGHVSEKMKQDSAARMQGYIQRIAKL